MCSIDEAWAGQDFDNKPVTSQADIHNAYMSLPDNIFHRSTEFNVDEPNKPKPRDLTRGLNSKYSREPRIPKTSQNTNNVDMTISSKMPPLNNYGGLEPLPAFMNIYENNAKQQPPLSGPVPTTTGDNFTDINNAFNTSNTINKFMSLGQQYTNNEKENFGNDLYGENHTEEERIINKKFNIKQNKKNKNKNKFSNINSKNNNNDDDDDDNNNDNDNYYNGNDNGNDNGNTNQMINTNVNIEKMLSLIINKLNQMEDNLHLYQKRNMYDIILYIIVGMLLSFVIYSAMKK